MSDCFVLYLLLTCMKKKTSGADKFTNNSLTQEKKKLFVCGMESTERMEKR